MVDRPLHEHWMCHDRLRRESAAAICLYLNPLAEGEEAALDRDHMLLDERAGKIDNRSFHLSDGVLSFRFADEQ
jgi:hypothetical protein